ncbi:MAG: folate-binding protein [Silvibacterium sp.]
MSTVPQTIAEPLTETPLVAHLRPLASAPAAYQGALTPHVFSTLNQELAALTTTVGLYDLGYTARMQITGGDRLRWLNGMVTNTIQALPENHWNYNLLLNAQGRIQGDANIYHNAEALILQTSRSQIARLSAHLDHFIIMDDVELQPLDAAQTTIGIAGPRAPEILAALGLPIPEESGFATASISGTPITLVHAHSPIVPRFEIWLPVAALAGIWPALQNTGAIPCGVTAIEALRILEATPLYGVDIQERHLAQETAQMRALNFNKGCYLGQEIVERIRSRATVHRTLRQFSVDNAPAALGSGQNIEINAEGAERNPVGELTSLAHYALPAFKGALALGFIRTEAVDRKLPLAHSGGVVTVLDAPPALIQ